MKRRIANLSLAVVVGVAVLLGAIWSLTVILRDHETLYHGQPLSYWVAQMASPDPGASNQANAVLIADLIPQFINTMFHDTNDWRLRVTLVDQLNTLPGVNIVFTDAARRRALAAQELGQFGPSASHAIPSLLQAIKGPDAAVHSAAILALGQIHGEPDQIIPLLTKYLDDEELRDEAADALGNYGPLAASAVPKLVSLLSIQDKDLHHSVAEALDKIEPHVTKQIKAN